MELIQEIESYWSKRSSDFMKLKRAEIHSVHGKRWMQELHRFLPQERSLWILDIGCGAGFFSILLAKEGHRVIGVDLTPDMVKKAQILAAEEEIPEEQCRFVVMDAENPDFPDNSFDAVVSRNLTWTLPHADHAYQEWIRILKPGGCLINADADYGKDNFADTSNLPEQHAHHTLGDTTLQKCEEIKEQLSISGCRRPEWDVQTLRSLGLEEVQADPELSARLYRERDEFYNPTPMFLLYGRKPANFTV